LGEQAFDVASDDAVTSRSAQECASNRNFNNPPSYHSSDRLEGTATRRARHRINPSKTITSGLLWPC